MSTLALFRLSAVAAIITGICIIVGSLLSNLMNSSTGTAFNFLSTLIGLFAITGFYLWQREQSGTFGVVAYVVVFIGLALIMCIDYFGVFIAPSLPAEEVTKLQTSSAMLIVTFSGLIFLVGEILFGISVIRAGVFSKIAAVFFMIGFLPTPLRESYPGIVFLGSVLAGAGIVWWGLSLWSYATSDNRQAA